MKKRIALFMSISLVIACVFPTAAFAVEETRYASMSTEQLAYCDINSVPTVWQDDVLEARNEIIHSTSWTVNGAASILHSDGTVESLPEFSDLFPGWDVPSAKTKMVQNAVSSYGDFDDIIYLKHPTNDSSEVFHYINGTGDSAQMFVEEFYDGGSTWNGAFDDLSLGIEYTHAINMNIDGVLVLNTQPFHTYGARVSTYGPECRAHVIVVNYSPWP